MQLPQLAARLDAELLDEPAAGRLVDLQRVGLAAGAVEGEHELAAQALLQRVLGGERFQLADQLGVLAEREVGLDPLCQAVQAQPPPGGRSRPGRRARSGSRPAAGPATLRAPPAAGAAAAAASPAASSRLPSRVGEREPCRVELLGLDLEQVAGRLRAYQRRLTQRLAQPRDRHLQALPRGPRTRPPRAARSANRPQPARPPESAGKRAAPAGAAHRG